MKSILYILRVTAITLTACVASCSINITEPEQTRNIKIGEASANGVTIQVYATDSVTVGYNTLFVKILDMSTNATVRNAQLNVQPIMTMGATQHSCPTEQTESTQITDHYFKTAAVFTMSSMSGVWELRITFNNIGNGKQGIVIVPVHVSTSDCCRIIKGSDNQTYILSLLNCTSFASGKNTIEYTLYKYIDDMNYEPVTNHNVEIEPLMPSMGHGSPNNVNPIHSAKGHYRGTVNFTMQGEWQIATQLAVGSSTIGSANFNVLINK